MRIILERPPGKCVPNPTMHSASTFLALLLAFLWLPGGEGWVVGRCEALSPDFCCSACQHETGGVPCCGRCDDPRGLTDCFLLVPRLAAPILIPLWMPHDRVTVPPDIGAKCSRLVQYPPARLRTWQFAMRAALLPRAPSSLA